MFEISDENYVALICNGKFKAIQDFSVGELFESFFDNINYNVVKKNENIYVDFTGEAMCDDKPCKISVRFETDYDAQIFKIIETKVDDEILNIRETLDLFEDVAYIGGAIFENDTCMEACDHSGCSGCSSLSLDGLTGYGNNQNLNENE